LKILTIGQGEIGAPLTKMLQKAGHVVYAKDIEPLKIVGEIDVMLVSIPFKQKESFCNIVETYALEYKPRLVIINSTVLPGTCDFILENSKIITKIVHSPVMGRHRTNTPEMMLEDIGAYPKFIGANSDEEYELAASLFSSINLNPIRMKTTKTSELSKLLETTYSGILIGWMQEVESLCNKYEVDWKDTLQLPESANQRIEFKRPTDIFPGFIGGHCIMPNIELLLQENESDYLTAVVNSNERKKNENS